MARKFGTHTPAGEVPLSPSVPSEVDALREALEHAVRELPREVRALPVFLRGFEADELLKAAGLGVDLLVLGSRPGGPLRRRLHKSVSGLVLTLAKCPVLIIPTAVAAPVATPA